MNRRQRTQNPHDGERGCGRVARGRAMEAGGVHPAGVEVGIDLHANDPGAYRAPLPACNEVQ